MKWLIWSKPLSSFLTTTRFWLQPKTRRRYGPPLLLLRHQASFPSSSSSMEEQSIPTETPNQFTDNLKKISEESIPCIDQNPTLAMAPSVENQTDILLREEQSTSKDTPQCLDYMKKAEEPISCNNGDNPAPDMAPSEEKKAQVCLPPTLSKNAQKKLLKMERYQAKKAERKAFEKTQRLEEKERRKKEWEQKLSAMSTEEQELVLKEKTEKKVARKERSNDRKNKMKQAMESGQNLVIDLEFADRMKPSELASLVQQVMYSYAANGKAAVPTSLSLTGCTGEILGHLNKVSGFGNWLIHKHEVSYLEAFRERKQDLVYLTADSECLIDHLEESKIYIIGGLVDRNRWKGLTLEKAKSQGIATAKLPISEHMKLTGSMVLTVNQVVEIFLRYLELKNWDMALRQIIPLRKRLNEDGDSDTEEPVSKTRHLDDSS